VPSNEPSVATFRRTRSEFAEALIKINSTTPFRILPNYPMFRAIYDGPYEAMLLKTSRQIGKSTTLANFLITESIATENFSSLFVAPVQEQTQKFSTQRVARAIYSSPSIRDHFVGDKSSERVLLREFFNGSQINFSYACDDADRIRGISASRICLDEVQDMALSEIRPVIKETLRESDHGRFEVYCGTPKTFENDIEGLWQDSTRTEWVMKCSGCNTHCVIVSEKCLTPKGPACRKCGKLLNTREGQWIDFNPGARVKGFHVSRPQMPKDVPACWTTQAEIEAAQKRWDSVWEDLTGKNAYSLPFFRNEVLGVSDSVGTRLVTREILESMRTGPTMARKPESQGNMKGVTKVAAGLDFSGGGAKEKSRTVLWITGLLENGLERCLYYKVYPGGTPRADYDDVASTLGMYSNLAYIAGDLGEGNMWIDMLRGKFGDNKVLKIQYTDGDYYARLKKTEKVLQVNRTRAIDSVMIGLADGRFQFAKAPDDAMNNAFDDILNEYVHITGQEGGIRKKVWRHAPNKPDDCLHALTFARIALQASLGQLNLTVVP